MGPFFISRKGQFHFPEGFPGRISWQDFLAGFPGKDFRESETWTMFWARVRFVLREMVLKISNFSSLIL
jgi:hypothetical protein